MRIALKLSLTVEARAEIHAGTHAKTNGEGGEEKTPSKTHLLRGGDKIRAGLNSVSEVEEKVDYVIRTISPLTSTGRGHGHERCSGNTHFDQGGHQICSRETHESQHGCCAQGSILRTARRKAAEEEGPGPQAHRRRAHVAMKTSTKKITKTRRFNLVSMADKIFKAYDDSGSRFELANQLGGAMVRFEKDGSSRTAFTKLVLEHLQMMWRRTQL